MKVKVESEKVGLKLNIQKMKIMASGPITSREIDGETVETVSDFIFWSSKITACRPSSRSFRARAERVLRAPRASPPPAPAESWVTRAFDPRSPEGGWKFPGMSPCSSFRGAPSISSPSHGRIPRAPAAPPPLNPAGNDVPPLCVLSSSSGSRLLTRSPRQVGPRRHRPGP